MSKNLQGYNATDTGIEKISTSPLPSDKKLFAKMKYITNIFTIGILFHSNQKN